MWAGVGHRWGFVTSKMATVLTASIQECDVYCLCGQGEFGEMIACDSPGCPLTWLHHKECVGLATVPVGFIQSPPRPGWGEGWGLILTPA